jgi:phage protein D
MAFTLSCRITIDNLVLNSVHSVDVVSTWKELSDKCMIKIPSRGVINVDSKLKEVSFEQRVQVGMAVKVELGYDEQYVTEFEGYVAEIKPGYPFELRCEDRMWLLKRDGNINKSYKSVKVSKLLKDLVPNVKIDPEAPDVTIDNFLIERATKAKVLQELKEKYGMAIYFRGEQLYAGLPYWDRINEIAILDLQANVVSDSLQYKRKDDVRLKAKAISLLKDNKKVQVQVGDDDGEERTLHYRGISDKELLRKRAQSELDRYKYEGYRGSVTSFGLPVVKHTQVIELSDKRYAERNGRYLVDSVRTSFSAANGYRREIEVAIKVSVGTAADSVAPINPIDISV